MEAIRSGNAGDAIVSFYPTTPYMVRPSFMELNLAETMFPGFRDAVAFLFPSEARKRVGKIFDTLHTLIEIVHAFDRLNPSTAAEKYLGFRRVRKDNVNEPFSFSHRIVTILEAIVIPYLLSRSGESDLEAKLGRLYKVLRASLATLYIIGITDAISPIQYLMGIRVTRVVHTGKETRTSFTQTVFSKLVWSLIYGIQLAQWYYSHESVLNPNSHRVGCSAPPVSRLGLPADPSICPICFKNRTNPTVLIATGHVYCYTCIWRWLSVKGTYCPVSGMALPPVSERLHYIRRLV